MNYPRIATFLAAASLLAACRPPDGPVKTPPKLSAESDVSFEACPVARSGNGDPFNPGPDALVAPDEKIIVIDNLGRSPAGPITATLEGAGKDFFRVASLPETIAAIGKGDLAIRFSPAQAGSVSAQLKLDDQDDSTEPITINLTGTGRNLPADPTLEVAVQQEPGGSEYVACGGEDDVFGCSLEAPKTYYGQATTLRVRVKNGGCPNLHITGAEVKPLAIPVSDNVAFYLDTPAVPPTVGQPLVLSSGGDAYEVVVRFTPDIDTYGKDNTLRAAVLELHTNDPKHSTLEVSLTGEAAAPAFSVTPTFCDLSAQGNACEAVLAAGRSEGTFTVHNEGNTALTLSGTLAKGGQSGRFEVSGLDGTAVPVGGSASFKVKYQDAPLYVRDSLLLTASAGGQEAGKQSVSVAGGVLPCMTTNPTNLVDFGDPAERVSTQTVELKNGADCGRLVVTNLSLSQSAPHFALVQEDVDAILQGGPIDAGQTRTFRVRYTKPVIGGSQTAQVSIVSNDPNASEAQPYLLPVASNSPVDTAPLAVCEVVDPVTGARKSGTFNVKMSSLVPNYELVVWADNSTDYQPDGTEKKATSFQFRLLTKPSGAPATLENDAKYTSQDNAKLFLRSETSAAQPGEYKVTVWVKDEVGQQSSPCVVSIFVNQ